MRNTGNLLKWTQNSNNKSAKGGGKSYYFSFTKKNIFIVFFFEENRNWIHPPEALQKGHIAYIVKVLIGSFSNIYLAVILFSNCNLQFLGNVDVDQPKGFNVIKDSIRKLKFNQQVRKAEGSKVPKVELTISVEGVALQDPKTKVELLLLLVFEFLLV